MAVKLNITNKAVSRWETGEGLPDVSILPLLASILGVSVDELLQGERKNYSSTKNKNNVFNYNTSVILEGFVTLIGYFLFLVLSFYKSLGLGLASILIIILVVGCVHIISTNRYYLRCGDYTDEDKWNIFINNNIIISLMICIISLCLPLLLFKDDKLFFGMTFEVMISFEEYILYALQFLLLGITISYLVFNIWYMVKYNYKINIKKNILTIIISSIAAIILIIFGLCKIFINEYYLLVIYALFIIYLFVTIKLRTKKSLIILTVITLLFMIETLFFGLYPSVKANDINDWIHYISYALIITMFICLGLALIKKNKNLVFNFIYIIVINFISIFCYFDRLVDVDEFGYKTLICVYDMYGIYSQYFVIPAIILIVFVLITNLFLDKNHYSDIKTIEKN